MRLVFLSLILVLTACQKRPAKTEVPLSDDEIVLQQFLDLNAQLEKTAYPLLKTNIASCDQIDFGTGFHVHTIEDFPENLRGLVGEKLGVGPAPFIRHVLPESPAAKAELKSGDEILAINDVDMITGDTARQFFETVGRNEFSRGGAKVTYKRGDVIEEVVLSPEKICGYPVQLFFADYVNAYTDGDEVWVTTELVNQSPSEESLALIIAHELAHATEGHIFKKPTRAFELEADRIGMTYLIRAGYDGNLALAEWAANPRNHKSQIGDSHPTFEERWRMMDGALKAAKN